MVLLFSFFTHLIGDIQMDEATIENVKLNTKEQFVVLILSTVAGFAASKLTENNVTKFIQARKVVG